MYLHIHLKESFFNYGLPHAFWCFAFERYNGILRSYHSNKKSIESQFMKKFLTNQAIYGLLLSNSHPLGTYFPVKYMEEGSTNIVVPSIIDLCDTPLQVNNILEQPKRHFLVIGNVSCNKLINLVSPFFESFFDPMEFKHLKITLSQLYPHNQVIHISRCFKRFGKIYLGESLIGSLYYLEVIAKALLL